MPDLITIGETMVLFTPTEDVRFRHAANCALYIGGAESTVAIALSRLGFAARWVSRLGSDELGDLVLDRIRAEGVDTSHVGRTAAVTGIYLRDRVLGGPRYYYYRGGSAASGLAADDFQESWFQGAGWLHLTGITPALSPGCRALVRECVAHARRQGIGISLDVNFRARLWNAVDARRFVEETAPEVDVLFAGDDEARALWGRCDPPLLDQLLALGPATVVIKRGGDACWAGIDGGTFEVDPYRVTVVDPTGAGDAFAAGYLAGRFWDLEPERRLRTAHALGAFSVSGRGDYEALPNRDELQAFMQGTDEPRR